MQDKNKFDELLDDIEAGRVEYDPPFTTPYRSESPTMGNPSGARDMSAGTMHGPRFPVENGDVVQPTDYSDPYFVTPARVVGEPND
ncbi:hypothetical protein M1C59_02760 [Gordonia terrae]|uniref:hypothetical protein n=1 Tax=Gordonia terrae TaxID=2055 RepID=UPI00200B56CF|nr:hypothetical protein [Gordonia terrae]UPW09795.1 hypothetical protein M1C59_02760 [Gordonia terrae]